MCAFVGIDVVGLICFHSTEAWYVIPVAFTVVGCWDLMNNARRALSSDIPSVSTPYLTNWSALSFSRMSIVHFGLIFSPFPGGTMLASSFASCVVLRERRTLEAQWNPKGLSDSTTRRNHL